jgi:hypothetical protein
VGEAAWLTKAATGPPSWPCTVRNRPHHIFGIVSELLPTMIIYPASLATWLFVTLSPVRARWLGVDARVAVAGAAALVTLAASAATVRVMERTRDARRARQERGDDERYATARAGEISR